MIRVDNRLFNLVFNPDIETVADTVEQGGVYFIYYKVLYSLPEGGLGV